MRTTERTPIIEPDQYETNIAAANALNYTIRGATAPLASPIEFGGPTSPVYYKTGPWIWL